MRILITVTAFYLLTLILYPLYLLKDWFKFFYHDIMKWHRPDYNSEMYHDGCSNHATCKYCGKNIMQDSQGNWFTYD